MSDQAKTEAGTADTTNQELDEQQGDDGNEDDEPTPAFQVELDAFRAHIDSLADAFPLASAVLLASLGHAGETLNKYLRAHGTQKAENPESYSLPPDKLSPYIRLKQRLDRQHFAREAVPRSLTVALLSEFDAFIGRLIRLLFITKPEALNASQRTLTLADILQFGSIETAKAYVIEKEVESVLRSNHTEQFEWLENRLGIPLRKGLNSWPSFVEFTERRNLFVHSNGIVTRHYLEACQHAGVNCAEIAAGTTLQATEDYFRKAYEVIYEIGVKLAFVMWRKLVPSEQEDLEGHLSGAVIYDLIFHKRYPMAILMADFAVDTFKKFESDYFRRMLIVNRAQAYKWNGDNAAALQILDAEDWSATSDIFQLSVASLKGDTAKALRAAKAIGSNVRPGKDGYREWPVFRDLRKVQEFQELFAELFGEPLTTVSVAPTPSPSPPPEETTDGTEDPPARH
jgi:hypothetical protein